MDFGSKFVDCDESEEVHEVREDELEEGFLSHAAKHTPATLLRPEDVAELGRKTRARVDAACSTGVPRNRVHRISGAGVNVIALNLATLANDAPIHTGECIFCKGCGAAFSDLRSASTSNDEPSPLLLTAQRRQHHRPQLCQDHRPQPQQTPLCPHQLRRRLKEMRSADIACYVVLLPSIVHDFAARSYGRASSAIRPIASSLTPKRFAQPLYPRYPHHAPAHGKIEPRKAQAHGRTQRGAKSPRIHSEKHP